jgi:hypothetical protein
MSRKRTALAVAVPVLLAAAFGVGYLILPTGSTPHHRSEVVTISFAPAAAERAVPDQHTGGAAWYALPYELPDPLDQSNDCHDGAVITLTLTSGETIAYGPCNRPAVIDVVVCEMINQPPGQAMPAYCGPLYP